MKNYILVLLFFTVNMINAQTTNWANFTNNDKIYDLAEAGDKLWVATEGGGVTIDQTTGEIKHYLSSNTDLPGVHLTGLSRAGNGNLWFDVYEKGISKFDGTQWTSFTRSNSAIPDSNVAFVRESENGDVWMVSSDLKNLIKYDGLNWNVYNSSNTSLPDYLGEFVFDSNGSIWMRSYNLGLLNFDGTNVAYYLTNNSPILNNEITDIVIDTNDNIWLSSYNGISKFDGQTWITYTVFNSSLPRSRIKQLMIHNDEIWAIWLEDTGLGGGLIKFDGTNWSEYNSTNSSLPSSLQGNLQITSNGDKWMLTGTWPNSQIIQFNGSTTVYHDISNSPLPSNRIKDIALDFDRKLWLIDNESNSSNGYLLSYKDYEWETYLQNSNTRWVSIQNDSIIWMGLHGGVSKLENGNTTFYNTANSGVPINSVTAATVDSLGNMWFASFYGLVKYDGLNWIVYDASNSMMPQTLINDIAVDASNNIWLGTHNHGLFKFDGINWENYTTSSTGSPLDQIWNLELDQLGNLWVGTMYYGIAKFDGTNWTTYNSVNSNLPSDNISALGVDNQNDLWIGTREGVARFDGANWDFLTTENSGLPHSVVYDFEFDDLDNVWMATGGGGLAVYNPNGVNLSTFENSLKTNDFKFNIYPVPFNDKLNVDIEKRLVGSSFVLYDINGRKVGIFELNEISTQITPKLNEKGMYFYNIVNDNRVIGTGKVIRN
ncbi:T9SS type A sorting domain-containing protein [Brumimicrobium glaciale]|uniref:T9SS type A sorting domain-containing protein n=1 Tax=Brumimicrobium glaciale TaxID=200475 RepID=A0A4Q4KPV0_9FLAO|nr:two-component regulator propeller domain-containing protein [Brumimicrobium glaciale]RYM35148.1 T9SS type A sorting domain-containing protein [Brumimicrobium glaciale]